MRVMANDVGDWLRRQHVGKRDHHEALRDDVVVIRPGPNFDWFMSSLAADKAAPPAPEQTQSRDDQREERRGHSGHVKWVLSGLAPESIA
jgi:hypothetical protein